MSARLWAGAALADMTLTVEVAFGADLTDSDGSGWSWTDVTEDVRQTPGISTVLGRGDEAGTSQPATLTLSLDNTAAAYSLGGHSPHWPNVRRGTPVRVLVDPDDGDGDRVVFQGYADGWSPAWDAMGAIPLVQLSASGTLRRLAQGAAPLPSAYRRSTEANSSVLAYWPMEESAGATYATAVRGGSSMTPSNAPSVRWGTSTEFESSGALPDVGDSGFVATVDPYPATGQSQVRFFVIVPEDGLADGTVLAYVYTTGTIGRWDIVYATGGNLSLFRYNQNGTLNSSTTNVTFDMDGNRRRLELQLTQDGADIDWWMGVLDATPRDPGGGISGTIAGRTFGVVSQVFLTPGNGVSQDASGTIVGHLTVQDSVTSTFEDAEAFWAWQGAESNSAFPEFAVQASGFSRPARLCAENGILLTTHTGGTLPTDPREGLGPQLPRPLLDLLRECETVDQGQLWDGRSAGLAYTARRYRENGTVALTLDAGAGELAGPFDPTDDDQRTRNRVTASRTAGVSATFEDVTGSMGTAVIGTYDSALEVNSARDSHVLQYAAWAVSLGTVGGYRYPSVTVDLRAAPVLAGAVLDLVPGDRVQVTDADHALAGFGPGTVDLIVEGIAHEVNAAGWRATLRCSWASPWLVARAADSSGDTSEFVLRGDTSGSTLAAAAPRNATALSVATSSGPLWTTTADDYPLTLDVGGVPVVATACSGAASPQTFTVAPLEFDRAAGAPVKLYDPRPLGL